MKLDRRYGIPTTNRFDPMTSEMTRCTTANPSSKRYEFPLNLRIARTSSFATCSASVSDIDSNLTSSLASFMFDKCLWNLLAAKDKMTKYVMIARARTISVLSKGEDVNTICQFGRALPFGDKYNVFIYTQKSQSSYSS